MSWRSIESFDQVWIDLCYCATCAQYVWHVEAADMVEDRDGFIPRCECGSRLVVVVDRGRLET